MLCLLLLGGILSETGMQGGILPQTVQAAGRYTGWKTVSGKRYYYQNGRMLKGMSKIGNDYYCFNYQGVQLKDGCTQKIIIAISIKEAEK